MTAVVNAINVVRELIAERRFAEFGKRCAGLIYDRRTTFGLRRDLQIPLTPPKAKIPISIREIASSDVATLFPEDQTVLSRKETIELAVRRAHYEATIPTCYVAVDQRDGSPCYFQWLMGSQQNDKIQSFFPKRWFPILAPDAALLENAYTPVHYRGNGIMSAAMALIAERAADLGARYVITFVESNNVPSLRGCARSGFSPHLVRDETRYLFNLARRRTFTPFSNRDHLVAALEPA